MDQSRNSPMRQNFPYCFRGNRARIAPGKKTTSCSCPLSNGWSKTTFSPAAFFWLGTGKPAVGDTGEVLKFGTTSGVCEPPFSADSDFFSLCFSLLRRSREDGAKVFTRKLTPLIPPLFAGQGHRLECIKIPAVVNYPSDGVARISSIHGIATVSCHNFCQHTLIVET